ncbi:uncharacterized protein PHACADRAFT_264260 [Phanerochaete carnosa HHB-10118-sp]|uniref:Protein-S-isoprenylcysteine O-methyltransferase n=1 Tax=Phanerochaete carnosa (strain HHB-10118-sp) TaxID=650164 RepID=K5VHQ3_PHACS|nr:uncharacterized protein PHACADRAFT_264260 [Phanerochaete carnosa HHB-10118-sp]EKM50778.1 hypothetical protein PHACADRAFT_264260 [Phanerochaete carnosa HHB-10118-sp]
MIWFPGPHGASNNLLKIPLLLLSTTLVVRAQTPPKVPPPTAEEREKYEGSDRKEWIGGKPVLALKTLYCVNLLCESAVILSEHSPSTLLAQLAPYVVRDSHQHSHDIRITPTWLAGCLLLGAGAALRLLCYRTLGKFFTWRLAIRRDHELVTSGPYAFVRHPGYLGNIMIAAGAILVHVSPGGWFHECVGWDSLWSKVFTVVWSTWSLYIPAMLVGRVGKEDEVLRKEFGEQWDRWAKRTPYRIFPYIY